VVAVRLSLDWSRPLAAEPGSGHNRWHPDLEPLARVAPGEEVVLACRDGIDGQLGPGAGPADVLALDLGLGHPLTGPVWVEGAAPGDLLEVEILAVEPADRGVTAIYPGFGLLPDEFSEPFLAHWQLADGRARSEQIPGVAVPCDPFPGVVGVAPSHELLGRVRAREEALRERGGPVADQLPERAVPSSAAGGLRTIPPRETGGNLDVRALVAGSRIWFPVHAEGALLSIGDLHAAQGDGEVCGFGIEVAGTIAVRVGLGRSPARLPRFPVCEIPGRPARRSYVALGMPIAGDGRNEPMDLTLSARNALRELIAWLGSEHGLTREQAYVLASVAADLRIAEAVDVPNPVVAAVCPLDIFEA
jgi:formamidase